MEKKGKGKEYDYYINELIFEGDYNNGRKNGMSKDYNRYLEFEGEFINGKRNGKGKKYIKILK